MTSTARRPSARRRLTAASVAAVTIIVGLAVHRLGTGDIGDIAGDALYAALIYLILVILLPRSPRRVLAAAAIIFCTVIEMLQLTDVPTTIATGFPPAFLLFGASFDQRDIIVYAFAIVIIMLADAAIARHVRPRAHARTR